MKLKSIQIRVSGFWEFCGNRTDDLGTGSPAPWPTELVLHRLECCYLTKSRVQMGFLILFSKKNALKTKWPWEDINLSNSAKTTRVVEKRLWSHVCVRAYRFIYIHIYVYVYMYIYIYIYVDRSMDIVYIKHTHVYMLRTCLPICVAVCCSVWQCVAVCCSVLQRVAVCCSVLHRFHVKTWCSPRRAEYVFWYASETM